MSDESVKWFRREKMGVAVDVKIERAPGYEWTWVRVVDAAGMLMSVAYELLMGADASILPDPTPPEGDQNGQ